MWVNEGVAYPRGPSDQKRISLNSVDRTNAAYHAS
jgi:hypothetical protein